MKHACEDCIIVARAGLKGPCLVHSQEAEIASLKASLEETRELLADLADDAGYNGVEPIGHYCWREIAGKHCSTCTIWQRVKDSVLDYSS